MKTKLIMLGLLVAGWTAEARRGDARPVPPVNYNGVVYSAPHVGTLGGIIEAHDEATGAELWSKRIYGVEYDSVLEEDCQWVYVSSLSITNGQLFVMNEANHAFLLDLTTRDVTVLNKDLVAYEPLTRLLDGVKAREISVPNRVKLVCTFLRVDRQVVEKLAMNGELDADQILSLWRANKAELLARPEMTVTGARENVLKSVRQIRYPTKLAVPVGCGTNQCDKGILMPVPSDFEMREVGTIMQCLAEVRHPGEVIRVRLYAQYIEEPAWKRYTAQFFDRQGKPVEAGLDQPVFAVYEFQNEIDIQQEKPVLLGGVPTADKKAFVFVLLTANLMRQDEPNGATAMK